MKKILSCVTLFFCLFLLGNNSVKAYGLKISCPTTNIPSGKAFNVSISADTYSDVNVQVLANGLTRSSGNGSFLLKNGATVTNSYYANKEGKYTITVEPTDGVNYGSASCEVSIGKTTSVSPNNTTKTTKKTTTKTTTTTKLLSDNANLSSLTIKDQDGAVITYSPEFKVDVYDYEVQAISDVKKIQIEATMEDAKANLVISDNINDELVAGEVTKIVLTVTAENGISKKSYNVNVTKEALNGDSTLKKLLISELPNFKFSSNITRYEVDVDKKIKKLNITCVPTSEKATCKVVGNEDLKNGSEIKVVVTAEDVSNKKEYTIVVNKKSNEVKRIDIEDIKDPLIIMCLSITAFALIGGIFYTIKR